MKISKFNKNGNSVLEKALQELTIEDVWNELGIPIPYNKRVRCPWLNKREKTLSIIPNSEGKAFKEFSTGQGGRQVEFVSLYRGVGKSQACKILIQIHQKRFGKNYYLKPKMPPTSHAQVRAKEMERLPELKSLNDSDIKSFALVRKIPPYVVSNCVKRGHFKGAFYKGHDSICVIDLPKKNPRFRRLDGMPYQIGESITKELGIKGGSAKMPLGWYEASQYEYIILTEGTPDFIAAHIFADNNVGVVGVTGASNSLPPQFLSRVKGKKFLLFPHIGDGNSIGEKKSREWFNSLTYSGADAKTCPMTHFVPNGVGDLNDALSHKLNDVTTLVKGEIIRWK